MNKKDNIDDVLLFLDTLKKEIEETGDFRYLGVFFVPDDSEKVLILNEVTETNARTAIRYLMNFYGIVETTDKDLVKWESLFKVLLAAKEKNHFITKEYLENTLPFIKDDEDNS